MTSSPAGGLVSVHLSGNPRRLGDRYGGRKSLELPQDEAAQQWTCVEPCLLGTKIVVNTEGP
jgi:hypothetical protein